VLAQSLDGEKRTIGLIVLGRGLFSYELGCHSRLPRITVGWCADTLRSTHRITQSDLDRLEGPGGLLERIAETLDEHTSLLREHSSVLRDILTLFHSLDERTARIEAYLRPPGPNG
jgi:hypothetical protein